MTTVRNGTPHTIAANLTDLAGESTFYELAPGDSVDVDARTALTLGEYGLIVEDKLTAIVEQDVVVPHRGERRLTDGRQHVSDDPRANVPGTPVVITGDTGSTDPERVKLDPGAVAEVYGAAAATDLAAAQGAAAQDVDYAELKGDALADAVAAANAEGAEIGSDLRADEKRQALVDWHSRVQ